MTLAVIIAPPNSVPDPPPSAGGVAYPSRSSAGRTTTSDTGPRICMPPSPSRPARCSAGSPSAIGATEFRQFLAQIDRATPPKLALHMTWFGQLERRAIRRGVFSQCDRTAPSLRRFIDTHNTHAAKPFRWTKSARVILEAVDCARAALRKETSHTEH